MAKLGIIAGGGTLPSRLIDHCHKVGRDFFVVALEGHAEPPLVENVPHGWSRLGAADTIFALLHAAGVTEVVFAGAVRRPSVTELRPDFRGARFLASLGFRALGDDGLLKAVKAEFEKEGFTLVGPQDLLADLLATEGAFGLHLPDAQAEADIAQGFRIIEGIGALDIGQGVVVQQGIVLGVEAIEGTDALIERASVVRRDGPGGVLVKAAKPGQERRIDLPSVGVNTVRNAAAAGLRGIAVEAGGTLVLERDEMVSLADELGLFVVGRRQTAKPLSFYLIAGEPSGDLLGAQLMKALRQRTGGMVRFAGIGGERMTAEGIESLIPISGLAIMGVFEVLPAAFRVLRWVRQTTEAIHAIKPDAVITIDSSGFCFRVAERLRRQGNPPLIIHYVAPMVWAWRAHRAKHAAGAADHLLTLLPFEPPYFEQVGLPATFVGHSAIEQPRGDGASFRSKHAIAPDAPVLCMLPGSRRGEVAALLPVFQATGQLLAAKFPDLVIVLPTVGTVADDVKQATAQSVVRTIVIEGDQAKRDAFAASTVALAASGTVALELALANVPMVISYRISPILAFLYRRMVKTKLFSLVNILLKREAIPELTQEACTPPILAAALDRLLTDRDARQAQLDAFAEAIGYLAQDGKPPSFAAADTVLDLVKIGQSGLAKLNKRYYLEHVDWLSEPDPLQQGMYRN